MTISFTRLRRSLVAGALRRLRTPRRKPDRRGSGNDDVARRKRLERLLFGARGGPRLTPVVDATCAVHDALVADGWEGTVAKRIGGRYRCGRRTNAWISSSRPRPSSATGCASQVRYVRLRNEDEDRARWILQRRRKRTPRHRAGKKCHRAVSRPLLVNRRVG